MSSNGKTYMPLLTMIEPKGKRISAFFSWIYFYNPYYNMYNGQFTFTRVFGWQTIRLK
jgi:hypothetical protein